MSPHHVRRLFFVPELSDKKPTRFVIDQTVEM